VLASVTILRVLAFFKTLKVLACVIILNELAFIKILSVLAQSVS